jgi:hypothetical protein
MPRKKKCRCVANQLPSYQGNGDVNAGVGDCQCTRRRPPGGTVRTTRPYPFTPQLPSSSSRDGLVGGGGGSGGSLLLDSATGTLLSVPSSAAIDTTLEESRHFARLVSGAETETGAFPPSYREDPFPHSLCLGRTGSDYSAHIRDGNQPG